MSILRLAVPVPLRRSFDYLPPESTPLDQVARLKPGCRILVPFGSRQLIGILLELRENSEIPEEQLKAALQVVDALPVLPTNILQLCQWAASYYQHPLGDVFSNALPALLRKGSPLLAEPYWQLTTEGKGLPDDALRRAPKQAQCLQLLQKGNLSLNQLTDAGLSRSHIKPLVEKGLAQVIHLDLKADSANRNCETAPTLNQEQAAAVETVLSKTGYQSYLLDGVTGSGKTEVYLQLIEHFLNKAKQCLVLVPEIGLTPQTLSRFEQRFNCPIAMLHSGLTDNERLATWQLAANNQAKIIIGTRSAVFTPMPELGLIIVDEEHDSSLKQQDGFRYSARDIAVKRALDLQCPVILGSATPSLESLHNAQERRYQHLVLKQRATGAQLPSFHLLDIRKALLNEGFSQSLLEAIHQEITAGNQVLVFINRRGYAPTLLCHDCGWVAQCQHCDARLTTHFQLKRLRCHHCDHQQALPSHCPSCNSTQLHFQGIGTERSERFLQRQFPGTPVHRIDRDTTSRKDSLATLIEQVHSGDPCILVGTQMLAKGHHFPDVTLVAMLDIDSSLFSADFRGPERMGQLLIQVSGRAGRASKPGKVIIQSHQPDHPLLMQLIHHNYAHFAQQLLVERKQLNMPPTGHIALIRADARDLAQAEQFLYSLRQQTQLDNAQVLGPIPSPMTKRAGRFRAQLMVHNTDRKQLHIAVKRLLDTGEQHKLGNGLHWSVDIDPIEMF